MDGRRQFPGLVPKTIAERSRSNVAAHSVSTNREGAVGEAPTASIHRYPQNVSESVPDWTSGKEFQSSEQRIVARRASEVGTFATRSAKRPRIGVGSDTTSIFHSDEEENMSTSMRAGMSMFVRPADPMSQPPLPSIKPPGRIFGTSPRRHPDLASEESSPFVRNAFEMTQPTVQPPSPSFNLPSIGSITHGRAAGISRHSPPIPRGQHANLEVITQDIHSQLSNTKSALQKVQSEHDRLLAAHSKLRSKSDVLERKSQVADREISALHDEKTRLQQQIQVIEMNVKELSKSKAELQKQGTADGAQWRQIMAMSSQLQIRSAEETRQFNQEREEWEQERTLLKDRIEELEKGCRALFPDIGTSNPDNELDESVMDSSDLNMLRSEVLRLRRICREVEVLHAADVRDADEIDRAVKLLLDAKHRIVGRRRSDR